MKLDVAATTICYFNDRWTDGPVPLMTSATNAAWLANTVFDGARAFEGVAPDLDLHCERVIRSAHGLNLQPTRTAAETPRSAPVSRPRRHPRPQGLHPLAANESHPTEPEFYPTKNRNWQVRRRGELDVQPGRAGIFVAGRIFHDRSELRQ